MRFLTAALMTETNSFSPFATDWEAFSEQGIQRGRTGLRPSFATSGVMAISEMASEDGHEVFVSVAAFAQPAGPTLTAVYEQLRDEILRDAAERGPFDGVLLMLHGAMIAEDYLDCEGDLLMRLRTLLGPEVFIGAVLDPHCHMSAHMTQAADVLILMREYPHVDGLERARDLYDLGIRTLNNEVRPVSALRDCRMVGTWPTTDQPMRAFVDRVAALNKRRRILVANIVHGFPWGDTPDSGARIHVVADGDRDLAQRVADEVAEQFWALRDKTGLQTRSLDDGLAQIAATEGLVVLADMADNAGGGAPSDSTYVLERVLALGVTQIALGLYWDPVSVRVCAEAGVGARVPVQIGGKAGVSSGRSVALTVVVRGYQQELTHQAYDGALRSLGPSVWLEADGVHLVLTTRRSQTFGPDAFTKLGLDLSRLRAVVVKSTQHFQYGFASIAAAVVRLHGPGALTTDFTSIPYRHRSLDYWPRVSREAL